MGAVTTLPLLVGCTESIPNPIGAPSDAGDATVGEGYGSRDGSGDGSGGSLADSSGGSSSGGSSGGLPDASSSSGGSSGGSSSSSGSSGGSPDGAVPYSPDAAPPAGSFCSLPGSVVWTPQGPMVIPGSPAAPVDITWLRVPTGFCAHYFGTVKTCRQLKFAPGGELFAASSTTGTTGGRDNGIAGIVVMADDDHDGNADANITFLDSLPSVQGLMFANGHFYYQDNTNIRRVPYNKGDRMPSGPSELVTDMSNWPQASEHWPKVFDQAQDGTIYITNGGSQSDECDSTRTVRGAIVKLNDDGTTSLVAKGFRNPIAIRCEANHDVCLAVELALDYSASAAGREKVMPVHQGDDWGFPCCATRDTPYAGTLCVDTGAVPDCSGVAQESAGFIIGHTPFGIAFETGLWPAPWNGRAYVTLHGDVGTYEGARVVGIAIDPNGMPLPSSELQADVDPNNMLEFATGWDDGRQDHGRPAPIEFAADGRMFVGDDQSGAVIWIAPVNLTP